QPGQQSQLTTGLRVTDKVDLEQVMAWKNGRFRFDHTKLDAVLRQLSRWYDVDIIYEKEIPEMNFAGEMGRDLKLSQVLKGLGRRDLHYRIEGRRLLILP